MTLTRRRHLVRSTAVAAVAGSALLLPAAAAFADSPQPTTAGSPGPAGDQQQKDDRHKDDQKKHDEKNGNEKKHDEKNNDQQKGDRKLVRTQNLSGGFLAKVYQLGPNHFQADMYAKDPGTGKLVKMDTLETKGGKPAYGRHNGAHFVLQPDGSMTSWVEGGNKKKDEKKNAHPGEQKNQRQGGGQQTKVMPKGGVKAGAEGVGETPDTPAMLLAGGGAAAAAAGLGFALLHRRKAREDA
ncbi:hypothetical protein ADK76_01250 [Streptomyces griseoflavus]|uniref:hypothetical protein n=1 Tax=Streptomyces rimosus TaxID=1927 RepID=UPI0004C70690|nr:hypothetical protein [Streptomyces rimosus]KOG66740.1 hypothetical protein ADK76_01250 [Streptomyces griseoflavus]